MPRGPEAKIQDAVVKKARTLKFFACKFESDSMAGMPDYFLSHEECGPFLMEFKSPTGKVSAIQAVRHQELAKAGVEVYVVNSARIGFEILEDKMWGAPMRHQPVKVAQ